MTKVFVCKQEDYDVIPIKKKILHSFAQIDFDLQKLKKNSTILIKPNLLGHQTPDKNVTTNPAILDAVLDILKNDCKDKDFHVIIGESSGVMLNGGTKKAFETSGLKKIADKYSNVTCIDFESNNKQTVDTKKLNKKYYLSNFTLPKILFSCDLIINLPKLKTHVLMEYTGAVKNFYGLIPGSQKMLYHAKAPSQSQFSKILADIYQFILSLDKPVLNIMDGVRGMQGNGPANGTTKKSNIIIVSQDSVALDVVATNIMGFDSLKLSFIKELLHRNINPFPINQLGITKITIPFKKAFQLKNKVPVFFKKNIAQLFVLHPIITQNKCEKCMVCLSQCPVQAINYDKKSKKLEINKKKCIHCFCCHELCPHDAIILKKDIEKYNIVKLIKNIFKSKKEV